MLVNKERLKEVPEWLPKVDLAAQRSDLARNVTRGTGKAFLDSSEFQTWMRDSGRVLYCEGVAGAGKSTMSCIILNHLEENEPQPDSCVFYWFCNYRMQASDLSEQFCGSLLAQLINQTEQVPTHVQKLKDSCRKNNTKPNVRDLVDCLSSFVQQRTTEGKRDFVVIDALDECGPEGHSRKALLELVNDIRGLPANASALSFLLTSRPLPEIKEFLIDKRFNEAVLERRISAESQDLELYLSSEIPRLDPNIRENKQLCSEICERVAANADGIFLLAKLHMEHVIEQALTVGRARKVIKNLPRGHDALAVRYNEAMERIQSQPESQKCFALALLKWVCFAERPLSLREMSHALALEDYDDNDLEAEFEEDDVPDLSSVVSSCVGLVVVAERATNFGFAQTERANFVQFAHLTVDEFFRVHRQTLYATAELDMTKKCMLYISLIRRKDGFNGLRYPLGHYCSSAWSAHARRAENEAIPYTTPFISNRLWMDSLRSLRQIYNLRNSIYDDEIALHLFARLGLAQHIRTLHADGLDIEAKTSRGLTAMYFAAVAGHSMVLKMLIFEYHAKYNRSGGSQYSSHDGTRNSTLLEDLCKNGRWECLEIILTAYHAEIDLADRGRALAAQLSFSRRRSYESGQAGLKTLLSIGSLSNVDLGALAFYAVDAGSEPAIHMMSSQGLDFNLRLSQPVTERHTPRIFYGRFDCPLSILAYAASLDLTNMIALLRKYGAIVPEEETLLGVMVIGAAANGNIRFLTELLNIRGDEICKLSMNADFYDSVLASANKLDHATLTLKNFLICLRLIVENETATHGRTLSSDTVDILAKGISGRDWTIKWGHVRGSGEFGASSSLRKSPLRLAVAFDAPEYFAVFMDHPLLSDSSDFDNLVVSACQNLSPGSLEIMVQRGANVITGRVRASTLRIMHRHRKMYQFFRKNSTRPEKSKFWATWQKIERIEALLLSHGARDRSDEEVKLSD